METRVLREGGNEREREREKESKGFEEEGGMSMSTYVCLKFIR